MNRSEQRRLALEALVKAKGHGAISEISARTDIVADYISRMLYPPGKKGRKGIGEGTWDVLVAAYPELRSTDDTTGAVLSAPERAELLEALAVSQSLLAKVLAESIPHVGRAFVDELSKLDPSHRNGAYVKTLRAGLQHELASHDVRRPRSRSRKPA